MVPLRSAMVTEPPGGSARSLSSRPSQRRSREAAITPTIRPSASRSGWAKGSTACRLTRASVYSPIVNSARLDRLAEVGAVGERSRSAVSGWLRGRGRGPPDRQRRS